MGLLGVLFGGSKEKKTAKKSTEKKKTVPKKATAKKEKKESYVSSMKRSKDIGYKSGYEDMDKLPKRKGAKTMARVGYGGGQKDRSKLHNIEDKYKKKSGKK